MPTPNIKSQESIWIASSVKARLSQSSLTWKNPMIHFRCIANRLKVNVVLEVVSKKVKLFYKVISAKESWRN
ncbi:UNVERIFIED_CONTAM: hypothetical protein GTU68_019658 [Idotea baltica]|nr:hypothetical protein [Idotea baltica]